MDANNEDYFDVEKKWLRVLGISFKNDERMWYNLYSFIIVLIMFSFPCYVIYSIVLNIHVHNVDVLLEFAVYASGTSTGALKAYLLRFHKNKVAKALEALQAGVFLPNGRRGGAKEEAFINKYKLFAHWQTMIICTLTVANVFIGSTGSLIKTVSHSDPKEWSLPYGKFEFFNVSSSNRFYAVWTFQTVGLGYCATAFSTVDVFMAAIIAYFSFQCQILGNFIKKSIENSCRIAMKERNEKKGIVSTSDVSKIEWKFLQMTIKEAVQYHMAIMDAASTFESIFRIPLLINYIGLSFIVCLSAVFVTSMGVINYQSIQQLVVAVAAIMLQLVTAYWGNEVKLQSIAIGEACYEASFVGTDVRFQKAFRQIMEKAQTPIQFTVGKFASLSLETFVTVLKTAYSYYMLLYNVVLKKST